MHCVMVLHVLLLMIALLDTVMLTTEQAQTNVQLLLVPIQSILEKPHFVIVILALQIMTATLVIVI
jgi:hypothetical protein